MVMLILGGTGRLYGAFLGGAVYMILEDEFSKLSPTFWQLGVGLLLVFAVLFARRGLIGLADDVRWLFGVGKAGARGGEGARRFVWRPEHWKELGWSALDGAILGFIAGFAVNVKFIEFLSTFVTSMPARALVFTIAGAAVAVGINLIYLFSTSRTSVEAKAS
jgi:hypothetical protein